jgi:hypothetical protein
MKKQENKYSSEITVMLKLAERDMAADDSGKYLVPTAAVLGQVVVHARTAMNYPFTARRGVQERYTSTMRIWMMITTMTMAMAMAMAMEVHSISHNSKQPSFVTVYGRNERMGGLLMHNIPKYVSFKVCQASHNADFQVSRRLDKYAAQRLPYL